MTIAEATLSRIFAASAPPAGSQTDALEVEKQDFNSLKEAAGKRDDFAMDLLFHFASQKDGPHCKEALAIIQELSQPQTSGGVTNDTIPSTLMAKAENLYELTKPKDLSGTSILPTALLQLALENPLSRPTDQIKKEINEALHKGLDLTAATPSQLQSIAKIPGSTLPDFMLTQASGEDTDARTLATQKLLDLYKEPGTDKEVRSKILKGAFDKALSDNKSSVKEGTSLELAYLAAQETQDDGKKKMLGKYIDAQCNGTLPNEQDKDNEYSAIVAFSREISHSEVDSALAGTGVLVVAKGFGNNEFDDAMKKLKQHESLKVAYIGDNHWMPVVIHKDEHSKLHCTIIDSQAESDETKRKGRENSVNEHLNRPGTEAEFNYIAMPEMQPDTFAPNACGLITVRLLKGLNNSGDTPMSDKLKAGAGEWKDLPDDDKKAFAIASRAELLSRYHKKTLELARSSNLQQHPAPP